MKVEARKSDVWSDNGECTSGWTCNVTYTDAEMAELLTIYNENNPSSSANAQMNQLFLLMMESVLKT